METWSQGFWREGARQPEAQLACEAARLLRAAGLLGDSQRHPLPAVAALLFAHLLLQLTAIAFAQPLELVGVFVC